jgi:predicted nucleic acid-binding Zn finger protein
MSLGNLKVKNAKFNFFVYIGGTSFYIKLLSFTTYTFTYVLF